MFLCMLIGFEKLFPDNSVIVINSFIEYSFFRQFISSAF